MRAFYNTISLEGEKLAKANARALGQEELIKEIFLKNPSLEITPSQMQKLFNSKLDRYHPITSIRRAMTNLSSAKHGFFLQKTMIQIPGEFGLPEHLWCKTPDTNAKQKSKPQQTLFDD